jgi:hypothetical protein
MSEEAREKGLNIEDRIRASNTSAAWEFIIEYAGSAFFWKGLRGKKTLLRGAIRTAEQSAEEVLQYWGEEGVAKLYNMRQTTREELMRNTLYTAMISTLVSGPVSFSVTIAENKGLLGQFRQAGFTDEQTERVIKGIYDGTKDEVAGVVAEVLDREASKIEQTDTDENAKVWAFLQGETNEIDPKHLPEIPEFEGVFGAYEFGQYANKLQIRAVENEIAALEQQISDLRNAGQDEQADQIENGKRLADLRSVLEGSGASTDNNISIQETEGKDLNDVVSQLYGWTADQEGPQLLGEPGEPNRKRTKSSQMPGVQAAGGKKAALHIIQKFLDGKKLTAKQQGHFDAMLQEFLDFMGWHINEEQQKTEQQAQQEQQEQQQEEKKPVENQRIKELKKQEQALENKLAGLKKGKESEKVKRQLQDVKKRIKGLEQREKQKQERQQRKEEREQKVKEELAKLPKLTPEQEMAVSALARNKNMKDAIRELKLRLSENDKQKLFGTPTPTDNQIKDFIKSAQKSQKEIAKVVKKAVKKLENQIKDGLKKDIKAEQEEQRLTFDDFVKNEKQRKEDGSWSQKTLNKASELLENMVLTGEKMIAPISTRLGKISPEFRRRMRKFDFNLQTGINKDAEALQDYMEGVHKLDIETRIALDLALKNGEFGVVEEINAENGLTEAFDKVQEMLDDVYARAEAVGLDIRYLENYWPRIVKDPLGMIEYFKGDKALWDQIMYALQGNAAEFELLSPEQQAYTINTLLRGFKNPKYATGIPGNLKTRLINKIDADLNKFYFDSDYAITQYIQRVNEAIETQRFFGKGTKTDVFMNINESIGHFVIDEVAQGNITPKQATELEDILRARFNPGQMGAAVGFVKDLGYITVLGNIDNAITQLGDMFLSLYKAGAFRTTVAAFQSLGTSWSGKDTRFVKLTREDLGIKQLIAEFNLDQPRLLQGAVTQIFKYGLSFVDNLGKETAINSILAKYQKLSKAKKIEPAFLEILQRTFGDDYQRVLVDLQEGFISDDVKFLLFNEIADAQPITLSEVPELYLKTGNGKIFYALKTFNIKLLDYFRNQAFSTMAQGIQQNDFKKFSLGTGRLLRLAAAYVSVNATADFLKDLIYGRPLEISDTLWDNILEIVFFDRYSRYRLATEGAFSGLVEKILPPGSIFDNVGKDLYFHYRYGDALLFNEELQFFETPRNIPIVGDPYYYWFGKGRLKSIEKEKSLEKRREEIQFLKTLSSEDRREYEKLTADIEKQKKVDKLRKRLDAVLPQGTTVDTLYDSLR